MKTNFLPFILFVISLKLTAQAPAIQWQNTIGGSQDDQLYALKQTTDNGYVMGGYSNSNISGDKTENSQGGADYWVVKLDASGNIQWQNTIGGSGTDVMWTLQQTTDGGYILGGESNSNISGDKTENSQGGVDYWVIKLDALGNIVWQNTIGGSQDDFLYSLEQTADGGFILGGFSNSDVSGDKTENSQGLRDYWVVKLDASGNILWQNTIGGSANDELIVIHQNSDGGFILGGHSQSNISGDKTENSQGSFDYWVLKLDASGNILWQNTIGGGAQDYLNDLQKTTDGGYIIGGLSHSNLSGDKTENSNGLWDYWVLKLDASGNIQWQNTLGGSGGEWHKFNAQTFDGGYLIGGYSDSDISGDKTENSQGVADYWIIKLDASGNIQWQNTIGGGWYDYLTVIQQTTDGGGFILGGYSWSNISGDKTENSQGSSDFWIVKLAPECLAPVIEWQNTIGGSDVDNLWTLQQTTDGGYILGGESKSNISGDKTENAQGGAADYWILKLDASGTILWQNTIGGSGYDVLLALQQTTDSGYIVGGTSNSGISGDKTESSQGSYDYWVLKLDAFGNIEWQNTIGGNGADWLYAIRQTTDGGYILGGSSLSNISGDKTENTMGESDYWVLKLDATGNIQWQNTIGGSLGEGLRSIQQTADGGYIVGGDSNSNISGDKTENTLGTTDYWIIKLDATGNIQWQNTIGGSLGEGLRSMQPTADGGYIVGGVSNSNISGDKTENSNGGLWDYWVLKLDASGNILWQNTIGGNGTDWLTSIKQTVDGGYIIGGDSNSNISGDKIEKTFGVEDYWIVKLNAAGNILWQNTIGGSDQDDFAGVQETTDGGYILGGSSPSNISGDKMENPIGSVDFWVLKLKTSTNFSYTLNPVPCLGKTEIIVAPVLGAVLPFMHKLDNGIYRSSNKLTVTQSGTYTVTVKDANNCETSQTIMVTVIPKLNATVTKTPVSCFGDTDGMAAANPTGGTLPYTYEWKQGATVIGTDSTISGLAPGSYSLKVTDADNCMKTLNFSITQPAALVLSVSSIVPQGANYRVKLQANGGNSGKTYRRCDDAIGTNCTAYQTNATLQNVPAGSYVFIVKDSKNCTDSITANVPGPSPFERRQPPAVTGSEGLISLAPNPFSDLVTLSRTGEFSAPFAVKVYDLAGRLLAEYTWAADAESLDLPTGHLPNGAFFIKVFAEDGAVQQVLRAVKEE